MSPAGGSCTAWSANRHRMPAPPSIIRSLDNAGRARSRRLRIRQPTAIAPDRASAETELFSSGEYGRQCEPGQPGAGSKATGLAKFMRIRPQDIVIMDFNE